jgi:hypothetical protein
MAVKGWTAQLAAAAGVAAGTGAAQLGLGYGLGVVAWPATVTDDDSVWLGSLGWATWIAASATVFGAVIASRLARRPNGPWRFALAVSAAIGALVTVALIALPARSAVRIDTFAPQTIAAGYAIAGILFGLLIAYWAVASRPAAANLIATAAWLWALAVAAIVVDLVWHRPTATYLSSWQFAVPGLGARYGTIYWPSSVLTLLAALLIGVIAAWPAVRRGDLGVGAASSGAVGPLLVAAAFFALAPRLTGALGPLESAYLIAPYAVLAGLAGSAMTVATGRRAADRRERRERRAARLPQQASRSRERSGNRSRPGSSPETEPEAGTAAGAGATSEARATAGTTAGTGNSVRQARSTAAGSPAQAGNRIQAGSSPPGGETRQQGDSESPPRDPAKRRAWFGLRRQPKATGAKTSAGESLVPDDQVTQATGPASARKNSATDRRNAGAAATDPTPTSRPKPAPAKAAASGSTPSRPAPSGPTTPPPTASGPTKSGPTKSGPNTPRPPAPGSAAPARPAGRAAPANPAAPKASTAAPRPLQSPPVAPDPVQPPPSAPAPVTPARSTVAPPPATPSVAKINPPRADTAKVNPAPRKAPAKKATRPPAQDE